MASVVFLLPREQMAQKVQTIVKRLGVESVEVRAIKTQDTLAQAHDAISNGADIIIARGIQASLIRNNTDYTVIEISATGQEMGLLVTQAKQMVDKPIPFIAVVGIANMFCDMEQFDQLYHIQLRTYFVDAIDAIAPAVDCARNDGAHIIIGGDTANTRAQKIGLSHLFVDVLGEEAIRAALSIASSVGWAIDLERKHSAQLQTLLDYSFNGIIKLSKDGRVKILNSIAEDMLNIDMEEAIDQPITSLIPQFDQQVLNAVLGEGHEHYAAYMQINEKAYAVSFAPILLSDYTVDGSILSFSEVLSVVAFENRIRSDIYFKDQKAGFTFTMLEQICTNLTEVIKKAKLYARTAAPILITGPCGSEKELLPQCIHNASTQSSPLYIEVNCNAYHPKDLHAYLFENMDATGDTQKGIISLLHNGLLVLHNIEALGTQSQHYLLNIIKQKQYFQKSSGRMMPLNIRLIATTGINLYQQVTKGCFHEALYYLLNTLSLTITPIAKRPDDVANWLDDSIKKLSQQYGRYISITNDAKKLLYHYHWPGNLSQLSSFCERIVITAPRRKVNLAFIESQLAEAYPLLPEDSMDVQSGVYDTLESAQIVKLLDQYDGSRTAVAQQLGISTTTLWRRMKKLGIHGKYQ